MSLTLTRNSASALLAISVVWMGALRLEAAGDPCVANEECDDTLFCNGVELCVDLFCQNGPDPCDDSVPCTTDTCDDDDDTCAHTPNHGACSDGQFCTGVESCHVTLGCQDGPNPNCDDLIACTVDACDEDDNVCTHTPNHGVCIDGVFCNGVESCSIAVGCVPGTPPSCSDAFACTIDECDQGADECTHTPDHSVCIDTLYCNGIEFCSVAGGCQPGTPPSCTDGNACSTDTCIESTDSCHHEPTVSCPDCSGDGVPDACVSTSAVGALWSDDIWGLFNGDYPDNVGHASGLFVQLFSPADITLDTDVVIRGLDVLDGATLHVTHVGQGDLTIKDGADPRIIVEGTLFVAEDREIDVSVGSFILSTGGRYVAASGGGGTASLIAADITVGLTDCAATDQMTISERMTVSTTGDFVLDGTGYVPCPPSDGDSFIQGGGTRPIFKVRSPTIAAESETGSSAGGGGFVQLNVGGSFRMILAAEVCVACEPGGPNTVPSIAVGGNFENESVYPSFFKWARGELIFPAGAVHTFEVAGIDLGPTPEGFNTDVDTVSETDVHTNFSVETIVVPTGSHVKFQNTFENTVGAGDFEETLYVRNLHLAAGSTVTLDGCNVYYCHLEAEGATIDPSSDGALIPLEDCVIPTVSSWGLLAMAGLTLVAGTIMCRRRVLWDSRSRSTIS